MKTASKKKIRLKSVLAAAAVTAVICWWWLLCVAANGESFRKYNKNE